MYIFFFRALERCYFFTFQRIIESCLLQSYCKLRRKLSRSTNVGFRNLVDIVLYMFVHVHGQFLDHTYLYCVPSVSEYFFCHYTQCQTGIQRSFHLSHQSLISHYIEKHGLKDDPDMVRSVLSLAGAGDYSSIQTVLSKHVQKAKDAEVKGE